MHVFCVGVVVVVGTLERVLAPVVVVLVLVVVTNFLQTHVHTSCS